MESRDFWGLYTFSVLGISSSCPPGTEGRAGEAAYVLSDLQGSGASLKSMKVYEVINFIPFSG